MKVNVQKHAQKQNEQINKNGRNFHQIWQRSFGFIGEPAGHSQISENGLKFLKAWLTRILFGGWASIRI